MATLYVIPHYDDELFCLGDMIGTLTKGESSTIHVLVCCGNDIDRELIFDKNMKRLENLKKTSHVKIYKCHVRPLFTNQNLDDIANDRDIIENSLIDILKDASIDRVLTCPADCHTDHKFINDLVRIQTRPDRNDFVDEVLEYYVPGSAGIIGQNGYNVFRTLSVHNVSYMFNFFEEYKDHLHGVNSYISYHKFLGYQGSRVGADAAEIYKQVFRVV